MTSVLHVIDASVDETQLQVLGLLRARMQGQGRRHEVGAIDGPTAAWASQFLDAPVRRAERRLPAGLNWSPGLADAAGECGAELVHAWGVEAARTCISRLRHLPLVMTLLDPSATRDAARWIRSFPSSATVAAGNQIIRNRLLASGLDAGRVVVIRGGVDFGAVNAAREAGERARLVGAASPVLLMSGPPSRGGGQFNGLWAAAIVAQIYREMRVILPYRGGESERLQRFARQIGMENNLVVPPEKHSWAQLTACADVFVAPAVEEVCTEPIGWAMGAGVVVVGSAVRSVAELIADRHNGLLCKAKEPRTLAARILTALEDGELRRKVTEAARGQAYEVFGVRAFVDNYQRLYENLLAGKVPGEGVGDTAIVA